jgi:cytochrome c5
MIKGTLFLIVFTAASLLACGKSEEPSVTPPPAAETPRQAEPQSVAPAAPSAALTEPTLPVAAHPAPETSAATAPANESASAKSDLSHGQQMYRQACAFCHDKGIAGAPKIGDAAAWSVRVAQGMNTLYASALHGKNVMPAKGGNPSLADTDVKTAVDFMVAQSR